MQMLALEGGHRNVVIWFPKSNFFSIKLITIICHGTAFIFLLFKLHRQWYELMLKFAKDKWSNAIFPKFQYHKVMKVTQPYFFKFILRSNHSFYLHNDYNTIPSSELPENPTAHQLNRLTFILEDLIWKPQKHLKNSCTIKTTTT